MRIILVWAGLVTGMAAAAAGQLAVNQPTEQLLLLPLGVQRAEDSAASIKTMDLARDRLASLARYKINVVPKAKLCEALEASGFHCDVLLDEQQARQLARFLNVHAYTTGRLEPNGGSLAAHMRVLDIRSSGLATAFTVTNGAAATSQALAEAVAQRLNTVVKASENVRECNNQRTRGNLPRAVQSAHKAIAADSAAVGAYLCTILVYEAQRQRPESLVAVARRVIRVDSSNATAWEAIRGAAQQISDTTLLIEALDRLTQIEPYNTGRIMGTAQLLFQMKRYAMAKTVLERGLAANPGELQMADLHTRVCIEAGDWPCALKGLAATAERDTTLRSDSTFLQAIIGAAQQATDTQALRDWTTVAVQRFPRNGSFLKTHGQALEQAGLSDSALAVYKRVLQQDPSDAVTGLLVAKTIVEAAAFDTAAARRCAGDTGCLAALRTGLATSLDGARDYLDRATASPDTAVRINATAIRLQAGQKLAQAQAYDRAMPWLDRVLQDVAPRTGADTVGPRQALRAAASFWWGVGSTITLGQPFKDAVDTKKCDVIKPVIDRLYRTKEALQLGRRVHEPTAQQMLGVIARFEANVPKIRDGYKCRNF